MRTWTGINADTEATEQGDEFASNVRLWIDGEMRRRDGMLAFTAASGTAVISFRTPLGVDYAIFATATGDINAVLAP